MKHLSSIALAALLCVVLGGCTTLNANNSPTRQSSARTLRLFNGEDLSNFYTYLDQYGYEDPLSVFTVVREDGAPAIRVSGEKFGGLVTRSEFENYHLVVEFRWGTKTWGSRADKAMDSGIMLHCNGPDGNYGGYWMASVECQIIQGGCGDFIMVPGKDAEGKPIRSALTVECEQNGSEFYYHPGATPLTRDGGRFDWYGRDPLWQDAKNFRGRQDIESPTGQWTRIEAICSGGQITNMVNGHVVNTATASTLRKGKILFQSEGAEIFFRRIELTRLD